MDKLELELDDTESSYDFVTEESTGRGDPDVYSHGATAATTTAAAASNMPSSSLARVSHSAATTTTVEVPEPPQQLELPWPRPTTTTTDRHRRREPVLVETVLNESTDEGDSRRLEAATLGADATRPNNSNINNTTTSIGFDLMPRNAEASIRCAMLLLLVLLVPAILLTVAAAPQYRFVVACSWTLVVLLLLAFMSVLGEIMQHPTASRNGHSSGLFFYPWFQAVAKSVVQEVHDFRDDWRQHVLMISDQPFNVDPQTANGPRDHHQANNNINNNSEYPHDDHHAYHDMGIMFGGGVSPTETTPRSGTSRKARRLLGKRSTNTNGDVDDTAQQRSGRPKSAVFRVLVKPFIPLIRRRRGRSHRHGSDLDAGSYDHDTDHDGDHGIALSTTTATAAASSSPAQNQHHAVAYVPPSLPASSVRGASSPMGVSV